VFKKGRKGKNRIINIFKDGKKKKKIIKAKKGIIKRRGKIIIKKINIIKEQI